MTNISKCDVCGKVRDTVVCCSACGAVSFSYCTDCLSADREPYSALVGMGLTHTEMNEDFKQKFLLPSLKFHNKTIEQFDADVQKLDESYEQWVKDQQKRNGDVGK